MEVGGNSTRYPFHQILLQCRRTVVQSWFPGPRLPLRCELDVWGHKKNVKEVPDLVRRGKIMPAPKRVESRYFTAQI